MKNLRLLSIILLVMIGMASCKSSKKAVTTTKNVVDKDVVYKPIPQKITSLFNDKDLQNWQHSDPFESYQPGMSVEKAYNTVLKGLPAQKVIVAVVDAGIDINHEDFEGIIWKNKDEIPNNGKDDDNNGYVDDVNGWNFLGNKDGRMVTGEQLELTRIVKKYRDKWQNKDIKDVADKDLAMFKMYKQAEEEYKHRMEELEPLKGRLAGLKAMAEPIFADLKKHLNTKNLTVEAVAAIKTDDENLNRAKMMFLSGLTPDAVKGFENYVDGQMKYNLNLDFNGRIQGDDPDNYNDQDYGNNNVIPPSEDELHGTHVAGIIAALRNNGKGGDGVSDYVEIMPVRAVPDGDEYDKDIALAFRYAVDNGAKIINTSFGKYYSPHKDWVWDAIKYAAKHDVLIVNGVGNEGKNMDLYGDKMSYPNDGDVKGEPEMVDNWLNVGATGPNYGADMVAPFSNYGKETVDVFSPGMKIYATVPFNKYKHLQGTSMASPDVAGVAALIRSRFPELSAGEVKKVIMDSGLAPQMMVIVPQEDGYEGEPQLKPFESLSKSGKIVNAYNAILMAKELAASKK